MHLGEYKFDLGDVYRNYGVKCYKLMSKEEFENIECKFNTEFDPRT